MIASASELRQQPGLTPVQMWQASSAAGQQHCAAYKQIEDRAQLEGRSLMASEQRAYRKHLDEAERHLALMAQLETQHDEVRRHAREPVSRDGVMAPGTGFGAPAGASGRGPLLNRGQSLAAWAAQRSPGVFNDESGDGVRLGALLRGWVTGSRDGMNASEIRAMSEGTASAGGVLVPTPTAARFIDAARNATRVIQAGASTVPMETQTLTVPRLTGVSAPAWRSENAAIATGDLTLDSVTLTAKSMAFMVKMSRELVEDATTVSVMELVEHDLAAQVALEFDRVALYGSGTDPEPQGVKDATGVNALGPLGGANGDTPADFDYLVDAVQSVRAGNFEPSAAILAPRTESTMAKMKDSQGQYLAPPSTLAALPRLTTNQIPVDLTVGTSTDCSDVFLGDWRMLYLGLRTGPLTIQLVERYADVGQLALLIWFRGDVALAQPGAFSITTGIRP